METHDTQRLMKIWDVRSNIIVSAFLSFRIRYCPRECNKLADAIASISYNSSPLNTVVSWDGTPPDIEHLVDGDSAANTREWNRVFL